MADASNGMSEQPEVNATGHPTKRQVIPHSGAVSGVRRKEASTIGETHGISPSNCPGFPSSPFRWVTGNGAADAAGRSQLVSLLVLIAGSFGAEAFWVHVPALAEAVVPRCVPT